MRSKKQIPDHLRASTFADQGNRSSSKGSGMPRLRSVESARLIEHQMYFWGRDVLHPDGNLLVAAGCQSYHQSERSHAVRCYQLETPAARITLHSTGVSLEPTDGSPGVVFLRPTHRLYHLPEGALPLPYDKDTVRSLRGILPREFPQALTTLLAFVQAYEAWAADQWLPEGSRLAAWREQKSSATKGIRWLKPQDSRQWLDACLASRQTADPNRYIAPEAFQFPTLTAR